MFAIRSPGMLHPPQQLFWCTCTSVSAWTFVNSRFLQSSHKPTFLYSTSLLVQCALLVHGFYLQSILLQMKHLLSIYEWCFRRGASLELANTIRRMINLVQDTIPFHSTHFAIVTSKVTWQINECVLNKYCRRFWTRWSLTLLTQPVFYWWPQKVSDPVASLRRRLQPADHKDVVTLISWSRPWSFGRSVNHAYIEGLRQ